MLVRNVAPSHWRAILAYLAALVGRCARFFHLLLDRVLAFALYHFVRGAGEWLFSLESALRAYLVSSRYVSDDSFERKLGEDRIVCLGMGLMEAESITLREISYVLGVSDHYARRIRAVAKNWGDHFPKFSEIMKDYRSDSEKGDRRSGIKN